MHQEQHKERFVVRKLFNVDHVCRPSTVNMANAWSTGLYDCFDDGGICCLGFFCAPCAYGKLKEEATGADCCCATVVFYCSAIVPCVPLCILAPNLRRTVRQKYQLPEEPCGGALQLLQIHEHNLLMRMVHHSQK
jgi:Cys-rich protein (TIGR01571 family)